MTYVVQNPKNVGDETKASDMNTTYSNANLLNATQVGFTPAITNGSFEQNTGANTTPTGWSLAVGGGNTCNIETLAANTAHGAQAFSGTNPGTNLGGVVIVQTNKAFCTPFESFNLRWLLMSTVATTTNSVKVNWFTNAGVVVSTTVVWTNSTTNPASYTAFLAPVTPPATAQLYTVQVELVNSNVTGTTYIDGIEVLPIVRGQRMATITSTTTFVAPADCDFYNAYLVAGGGGGGQGGAGGGGTGSGGAAGSNGGNTWIGSSGNAARGGTGGLGGGASSGTTAGSGAAGQSGVLYASAIASISINFGIVNSGGSGTAGTAGAGGAFGKGGTPLLAPWNFGITGLGGATSTTAGTAGSTNTGAGGGGGAGNTGSSGAGGGGGAAGAPGEFAIFNVANNVPSGQTVTIGAGGLGGTGAGGGAGGNGGSGLAVIFY